MESLSLNELADEQLAAARAASSGRSAQTLYGGQEHALRQTLVALAAGRVLDEHESPGQATLQVLRGRARLLAGEAAWELRAGDYAHIPNQRHGLEAVEDSVVLLTVAVAG
jgi:quercetin dioxygenase-like cupin family protein